MKIDYLLLDVFTRTRLAGNPLAVVPRADGLLDNPPGQAIRAGDTVSFLSFGDLAG